MIDKPFRCDLWRFFHDEHGLTLLESELDEIVRRVKAQMEIEQDMHNSPEYQAFIKSMVQHCRCEGGDVPCAGVLAGGICDMVKRDESEEDRDEYL